MTTKRQYHPDKRINRFCAMIVSFVDHPMRQLEISQSLPGIGGYNVMVALSEMSARGIMRRNSDYTWEVTP